MASDVDDLFRIYGDPQTNTFNPAGPYPDIDYTRNILARWLEHWENYGFGIWVISMKDDDKRVIGFGGLQIRNVSDSLVNNLGYRFAVESWGKGLATEFANYAVNYGFAELNLPEISALVRANHRASQKVLTNAGLKHMRDIQDIKNAPASMFFSLTKGEWINSQ